MRSLKASSSPGSAFKEAPSSAGFVFFCGIVGLNFLGCSVIEEFSRFISPQSMLEFARHCTYGAHFRGACANLISRASTCAENHVSVKDEGFKALLSAPLGAVSPIEDRGRGGSSAMESAACDRSEVP